VIGSPAPLDVRGTVTIEVGRRTAIVTATGSSIAIDLTQWSLPGLLWSALIGRWVGSPSMKAIKVMMPLIRRSGAEVHLVRHGRVRARIVGSSRPAIIGRLLGLPGLRLR
jgi:tetrahydromethanopterin S-methyltransferase subunit C